jgi:isochorismate hydrolase
VSELAVDSTDPVVVKKRYSAFFNTVLDETLARLEPDSLILAGINTHACVRMTAIDAYQRDWRVVLAVDCLDSYDREHHEISLRHMQGKIAALMSNDEIRKELETARLYILDLNQHPASGRSVRPLLAQGADQSSVDMRESGM